MTVLAVKKTDYILITGASSGIGRCIAVGLSSRFNLILLGRREDYLNKTKSLCDNSHDQLILNIDLSNTKDLESLLSLFLKVNKIEVINFVHCAGAMQMLPLKMISADSINMILSINFTSAALISKVLMQRSINSSALKGIIFISSNISNFGSKAFSIYAASKSALDSLMRCLAVELAPRVRVNSVLPGAIHTEMTEKIFDNNDTLDRLKETYPLGLGEPEDIYSIVDFLLSENSRWITGQQFVVDGGRTINITG
jgi:NAD(P)-dependent dehydrogenase (short-subunit alcohol dehydrogenase family)